jgi:hypothetical protein
LNGKGKLIELDINGRISLKHAWDKQVVRVGPFTASGWWAFLNADISSGFLKEGIS